MTETPKVLIANRGEIAVRIIRTTRKLGIRSIAIYTLPDADTPHVAQADEAYLIGDGQDPKGYLDIEAILDIARKSQATMIAPGYGFLSENVKFVEAVEAAGIIFLGPTPYQMTSMGLKHEARAVAEKAGVPIVPGSKGVIDKLDLALVTAEEIGYPIMLKASAGGGGMGMTVCRSREDLIRNFEATREKGAALFKDPAVFLEKYISRARHVEVQIFGNGEGHVVHFGERECSVQRRHQKVIEESPCSLFQSELGQRTRQRMCEAAVKLGEIMKYRSAGTVEFVLDDESPTYEFFLLELNARIQVEHAVTEVVRPGLDLVELMIRQGMSPNQSLPPRELSQDKFAVFDGHSIEARVYCENPIAGFRPSPGRLQSVEWADIGERGRIDTWVKTGTLVTPNYDPMIAKLVVWGKDRPAAIAKMREVLKKSTISGPVTNIDYCDTILATKEFQQGSVTTVFLDTMPYAPPMMEILAPGLSTTVQDLPGRFVGIGIPRGGAADMLSFQAANALVGNDLTTEGLEMTMIGAKILFHTTAVIAVTGAENKVTVDKEPVEMWSSILIKAGSVLKIGTATGTGLRIYLAVKGGLLDVADYMGSKSTFAAASLGGHQGRVLLAGDMLEIEQYSGAPYIPRRLSETLRPQFGTEWEIEVTPSSQWDEEYLTQKGMKTLLESEFTATTNSSRAGIRLDGPIVEWARESGGNGGSHPSNVLDQGYPFGALNMNGDTPVLFGTDGPDLGGFINILAVTRYSMWKMGQIKPHDKVRFVLVAPADSAKLSSIQDEWLAKVVDFADTSAWSPSPNAFTKGNPGVTTSTLYQKDGLRVSLAGDEFLLLEQGPMAVDIPMRFQLEIWERKLKAQNIPGIVYMLTCIRSSIVHFNPKLTTIDDLVKPMVATMSDLGNARDIELSLTIYRLPIVIDDPWCQKAVEFYMASERNQAVYLPNNGKYVARNNGVPESAIADSLLTTPWIILAQGFFASLPLIVPMDPRLMFSAQKYNPSRTRTPEGAVGLAGAITAIYPIEAPGGYQLLGRTLTTWQPWSKKASLVNNFDKIEFFPVTPDEFEKLEREYKAGLYQVERRPENFKMSTYLDWLETVQPDLEKLRTQQEKASKELAAEELISLAKWRQEKAEAAKNNTSKTSTAQDGLPVTSPLSASVWKVLVPEGHVITDEDEKIIELEAMKTSVWITPGEDSVGKTISSIVVKDGDVVSPGEVLVYLT